MHGDACEFLINRVILTRTQQTTHFFNLEDVSVEKDRNYQDVTYLAFVCNLLQRAQIITTTDTTRDLSMM